MPEPRKVEFKFDERSECNPEQLAARGIQMVPSGVPGLRMPVSSDSAEPRDLLGELLADPAYANDRPRPRGRGATPQVTDRIELPRKSPTGHTHLQFRYRPLTSWTQAEILTARKLAISWSSRIGGLRLCTDSIMRCLIQSIQDFGAVGVESAIVAKSQSLRRPDNEAADAWRKRYRTFRGSFSSFLDPSRLQDWITRAEGTRLDAPDTVPVEAPPTSHVPRPTSDVANLARRLGRSQERNQARLERAAEVMGEAQSQRARQFAAHWSGLSASQRSTIIRQIPGAGLGDSDGHLNPTDRLAAHLAAWRAYPPTDSAPFHRPGFDRSNLPQTPSTDLAHSVVNDSH